MIVGILSSIFSPFQHAFAAPTWSVLYSTTSPTNQDVIATVTTSESVTFLDDGPNITFSSNGPLDIKIKDATDTVYHVSLDVNNIDKNIPQVNLSGSASISLVQ